MDIVERLRNAAPSIRDDSAEFHWFTIRGLMLDGAAEIEKLEAKNLAIFTALEAANYYIDRLESVQQRRVVRDMTEAMEGYHNALKAANTSLVRT